MGPKIKPFFKTWGGSSRTQGGEKAPVSSLACNARWEDDNGGQWSKLLPGLQGSVYPSPQPQSFPRILYFRGITKKWDACFKYAVLIAVPTPIRWTWNFERCFFLSWRANAPSRRGLRFFPDVQCGCHSCLGVSIMCTNKCSQHSPDLGLTQIMKKPQWTSSIHFLRQYGRVQLVLGGRRCKLKNPSYMLRG